MKKSSILMMLMALMMSATSFAQGIKGTVIDENGDAYEVTVTIKNTGNHEGKEVVELYISAPGAAKAAIKQEKSDAGIGAFFSVVLMVISEIMSTFVAIII